MRGQADQAEGHAGLGQIAQPGLLPYVLSLSAESPTQPGGNRVAHGAHRHQGQCQGQHPPGRAQVDACPGDGEEHDEHWQRHQREGREQLVLVLREVAHDEAGGDADQEQLEVQEALASSATTRTSAATKSSISALMKRT